MPLSRANTFLQQPQRLMEAGGTSAFAPRPLLNTVFDLDAAGPIGRGHFSASEIFAMSETQSRWAHAASIKTAISNTHFLQEQDHEAGE